MDESRRWESDVAREGCHLLHQASLRWPCRWLMSDESSAELRRTCPREPANLAICQSASVVGGLELTGWIDC